MTYNFPIVNFPFICCSIQAALTLIVHTEYIYCNSKSRARFTSEKCNFPDGIRSRDISNCKPSPYFNLVDRVMTCNTRDPGRIQSEYTCIAFFGDKICSTVTIPKG